MRIQLLQQFEEVVQQHHKEIVNFHYRLVGNRMEAEDLAQETFLKAYNKFDTLEDPAKAKSWLYSIARNVTIDFFRKNKNRSIPLEDSMLEHFAQATAVDYRNEVVQQELSQELARCLEALNTEDRMIMKLLYYEGFSYKEIGLLLHINPNTLKSRLHRARKVLLDVIRANESLRGVALSY